MDEKDIGTIIDNDRGFQFRVGLYANGWHDDKQMKGCHGTRNVWYDGIAAGTTLVDIAA